MSIRFIILGAVLLLIGAALPFAMVIRILDSTFFLNFLAAISSIFGLIVGFIGIIEIYQKNNSEKL